MRSLPPGWTSGVTTSILRITVDGSRSMAHIPSVIPTTPAVLNVTILNIMLATPMDSTENFHELFTESPRRDKAPDDDGGEPLEEPRHC